MTFAEGMMRHGRVDTLNFLKMLTYAIGSIEGIEFHLMTSQRLKRQEEF